MRLCHAAELGFPVAVEDDPVDMTAARVGLPALRRLPLIIELPVPRGIFVWRVQDGALEEAIVHLYLLSLSRMLRVHTLRLSLSLHRTYSFRES
jgi:hypothetical protein